MSRMTIVKWAVAALLAVPAVPMFAKTVASHKVTTHAKHHTVATSHKKHHVIHHKTRKPVVMSSSKAGRKMSTSVKHSAKQAASHPQVEAVHQPTIDGMHT